MKGAEVKLESCSGKQFVTSFRLKKSLFDSERSKKARFMETIDYISEIICSKMYQQALRYTGIYIEI